MKAIKPKENRIEKQLKLGYVIGIILAVIIGILTAMGVKF